LAGPAPVLVVLHGQSSQAAVRVVDVQQWAEIGWVYLVAGLSINE
jgi:hypothetical protein